MDLDGVSADISLGAHRWFNCPGEYDRPRDPGDISAQCGYKTQDERNYFWGMCGYDFCSTLPPMPEFLSLYAELREIFGDHMAVLSKPWRTTGCADGKLAWVRTHMPELGDSVFLGGKKWMVASPRHVLIDDFDKQVDPFRAEGGKAVLIPRPWNTRAKETDLQGCFDVKQIVKEVKAAVHSIG